MAAPNAPTNVTATVNSSSTKVTVTWTNHPTSSRPYSSLRLFRSVDGSNWAKVADLAATKASFTDGGVADNRRYRYLIRAYNSDGHADGTSNYAYSRPAAPSGLTAYRMVIENQAGVQLNWADNAPYEDSVTVCRYDPSDGEWHEYDLGPDATSYFDAEVGTAAAKYRVYASTDSGIKSSYSNTVEVPDPTTPAAPTIITPAEGSVYNRYELVPFTFIHNTTDMSRCVSAMLQFANNPDMSGGSQAVVSFAGLDSDTVTVLQDLSSEGSTVYFRIATKGFSGQFGEFSPVQSFRLASPPSVIINDPSDESTVTGLPIHFEINYADSAGFGLRGMSIWLRGSESGPWPSRAIYRTGEQTYSWEFDWISDYYKPVNGETVSVRVAGHSTSGLTTEETSSFTIDFIPPNPPALTLEQVEGGAVQVYAEAGTGSSSVETGLIDIIREDGAVIVSGGEPTGVSAIDYLPELDRPIKYKAIAYAALFDAYAETEAEITVDSDGCIYINYGDGFTQSKAIQMDVNWSISTSNKRGLYQVRGRKDPVVRTTPYRERKLSASGTVRWIEEDVSELQDIPGTVYLREPHGGCIPCVMDVSANYVKGQPLVTVDLSFVQVSDE